MHRNKNASPLLLDSYPKETKLKKVIKIKYPDERISALLRKRPGFSWEDLSSPPTPSPPLCTLWHICHLWQTGFTGLEFFYCFFFSEKRDNVEEMSCQDVNSVVRRKKRFSERFENLIFEKCEENVSILCVFISLFGGYKCVKCT